MSFLLLLAGLILLVKGADWVVDSAAKIANNYGVPAFMIGLTIVALGTSAPEATVGILSGLKGANQLTLGDVIGSSIINITLVIGLTALIKALQVDPFVTRREIPISLLVQGAVTVMIYTGLLLSQSEAVLLLAGMAIFTAYIAIKTRRMLIWNLPQDAAEEDVFELLEQQEVLAGDILAQNVPGPAIAVAEEAITARLGLFLALGLAAMVFGANLVVDSGVAIALQLGFSQEFIGLTLVAFGTSLPELVTCLTAARKKQADIAVGNIVGSNIFNILFVLGLSGAIHPIAASSEVMLDMSAMLLATLLLLVPAWWKQEVSRFSGLTLIGAYILYLALKISGLD
ncbi:MAG: calcium/sodium antiporter [Syntrophomonadaceae bacterium]